MALCGQHGESCQRQGVRSAVGQNLVGGMDNYDRGVAVPGTGVAAPDYQVVTSQLSERDVC
jgi:hypothetical protein